MKSKRLSLRAKRGNLFFLFFLILLTSHLLSFAAEAATLNLRATWDPNTEPDMKEYRLYRTDGTRVLVGTIPHPTASYNFPVTVPDNSSGTLSFVITAVDTSNNESLDSTPATFAYDLIRPAAPKNVIIIITIP